MVQVLENYANQSYYRNNMINFDGYTNGNKRKHNQN